MSLALLIGVTLHLSWELSTSEEEVRRVAEDVAILRADVEALRAAQKTPRGAPRRRMTSGLRTTRRRRGARMEQSA